MRCLQRAWHEILDALYPRRCAGCGMAGYDGWCEKCTEQIEFVTQPVCTRCGTPLPPEEFCASCTTHPFVVEAVRAAAYYRGVVKRALHRCKYGKHPTVAPALAELLIKGWHTTLTAPLHAAEVVIPVPIHCHRERERGFNQSMLIAKSFCDSTGLPLLQDVMERTVYRRPQVGLDAHERQQNVKDAFRVVKPERVAGKSVLLVDDVWTTGSTLNESAKALFSAGASRVFAYTVAHESLR
ncbi:MAG: double zinc ribbon domain-containing protein [Armatimonadota bacterium]